MGNYKNKTIDQKDNVEQSLRIQYHQKAR